MGTVPASSIAAMAVSLAVCVGLPVGLCIYMKKAGKASLKSFFLGCGTFVVFALILEQVLHLVVRAVCGRFLSEHLIAYAVYGGLAAGLFEETGRYVAMKFFMKDSLSKQEAVMYGAGHGGIEAILLGGMACFSNLLTSVMINSGSLEKLLPAGDAGAQAVISQLTDLPSWQFLFAGMERCSAVVLHIVLSYLVYLGVKNSRLKFYLLAVMVHFLVDAAVVLAAACVPVLAVELGLLAVVLVLAAVSCTCYSRERQ